MGDGGIVFVGAGGHCKVVLDSLDKVHLSKVAIIDENILPGSSFQGVIVLGNDEIAPTLIRQGYLYYFIALLGNMRLRSQLIDLYESLGYMPVSIIHQTATVSQWATINEGVFIGPRAVVNAGAHIEKHVTVNTGGIVEHDAHIGAFSHLAPGSIALGGASVGEQSFIGAGSVILQQCCVGDNCIIGANSMVNQAIPNGATAFGLPARLRS